MIQVRQMDSEDEVEEGTEGHSNGGGDRKALELSKQNLQWELNMCLHQNLEEGFQRLESSQNHVSKGSIACRSKIADSDAALESAFFR